MRATLQQIADRVGVHPSAVSRVLAGKADAIRIGRKRVLEIQRVARDLAYRPNAAARAIRRGQFGCAALVLSEEGEGRSRVTESLLRGLTRTLDASGMHLTFAMLRDEQLTSERFVPKILREWMADGLLVNYNKHIPPRMAELIEDYNLPVIWLNDKRPRDCVHPDDLGAGRDATEHLLAAGHRRIAYVSYSYKVEDAHYSESDRRDGYLQVMHEAGLPCETHDRYADGLVKSGAPASLEARNEVWRRVLARADRPTGVVVYGASTLRHVLRAAEDVGLSVPRDLSVVTFGGMPTTFVRQIATVVIPEAEVGRVGVEMLLAKIATPGQPLTPRVVAVGFQAGETVSPPQAAAS